ncbi:Flp pilus assembly protein TadG [Saccharomonospora amisosensis]|uniref:Flp pilus assembly protein TadG n=1 Tax=Saccharomonospora amisosensis TaxID=1128677 RepID=A0A7X5ZPA1_9PSEU|nr:pilus assembly protein TadG-related protein [Saccharomonospora amisosensis]NIJ10512.1 Flp pilus assembly protein TadG [Saccharomonospora amisosensis]
MNRGWRQLADDENGRVTAFVVLITTACLLFAGLVLDGGLALSAKTRAIGQAEEAARAGAQELDLAAYRSGGAARLQPTAAISAAQRYLNSVGASGTVTVAGNTVNVSVTAHQPTQLLGLIGITDITVSGDGHAQPDQGDFGGP